MILALFAFGTPALALPFPRGKAVARPISGAGAHRLFCALSEALARSDQTMRLVAAMGASDIGDC